MGEQQVIELSVPAMNCGHCVRVVTDAVHAVDPAAKVDVDLAVHRVTIETAASRVPIAEALTAAGYPPG